jgi:hypothetical protein
MNRKSMIKDLKENWWVGRRAQIEATGRDRE